MPRPTTRQALLDAGAESRRRLDELLASLPPDALTATFGFEDRDRCVRDVLGHLDAWNEMMLGWYTEGMAGRRPAIPAEGHTWRTLPALNATIWQHVQRVDLASTRTRLDASRERVRALVVAHTDDELFTKRRYAWTGTTSLGAYLVSCTSSHDEWAIKKIRRHARAVAPTPTVEGPDATSGPSTVAHAARLTPGPDRSR